MTSALLKRKRQACAKCEEISDLCSEGELRARGWRLVELSTFSGRSGGYTLLCWLCPAHDADPAKTQQSAI